MRRPSSKRGAGSTTRNDPRKDWTGSPPLTTPQSWQRNGVQSPSDSKPPRYSRRGDVGDTSDERQDRRNRRLGIDGHKFPPRPATLPTRETAAMTGPGACQRRSSATLCRRRSAFTLPETRTRPEGIETYVTSNTRTLPSVDRNRDTSCEKCPLCLTFRGRDTRLASLKGEAEQSLPVLLHRGHGLSGAVVQSEPVVHYE